MQTVVNRIIFGLLTVVIVLTIYLNRIAGYLNSTHYKMRNTRRKMDYRSCPDDVFIVTYPKSGTTWMQMILFQLITSGEMDIKHIGHLLPDWDELEEQIENRSIVQDYKIPRIFKSHFRYRDIPKGNGRYIYVVRDGLDVAVSGYYHARKFGVSDSFESFFRRKFMTGSIVTTIAGGATWFEHVAEWTANENQLNVLFVRYEDLVADLSATIRRIANFCGIEVSPRDWSRILHNCSFDFMRLHETKIDPLQIHAQEIADEDRHFIRRGKVGEWREYVDEEMLNAFHTEGRHWLRVAVLEEYCRQAKSDGIR